MALYEDLRTLEDELDARLHIAIARAGDIEMITRLTARIVVSAQRHVSYNSAVLRRICDRLKTDISDIHKPEPTVPTSH